MKRFLLLFLSLPLVLSAQFYELKNDQLPISFTLGASMDVESADLDGDGDPELIIAGEALENLVFFNDGQGNFTRDPNRLLPELNPNDQYPGEDSEDIGIADFDQDGDLDLIFVSEDTPNHELLLNDGNGGFSFSPFNFPASIANALAILDINEDSYPDIIIGNKGANFLFINDTNGGFTNETATRWPNNTDDTQDLKTADIDDDGDLDIIEGAEVGGNNIYINMDGVFEEENQRLPDFNTTMETRKVSVGDLNNDGHADLYFSNVAWTPGISGKDRLLFNDGNGFFTDVTDTNVPSSFGTTLEAAFEDFNNDGHVDILTTNFVPAGQQAFAVFINNGTGVFAESNEAIFPAINYSQGVGLHIADLNGDGHNDVYFANYNQSDQLFFFIPPTATNEVSEGILNIEVTPNPASSILNVDLPSSGKLRIIDASGKIVLESYTPTHSMKLNIHQLPKGTYGLTWTDGQKQLSTIFIKQ